MHWAANYLKLILVLLLALSVEICLSQYGGGGGNHGSYYSSGSDHYGSQGGYGGDERPKVHLGIRLRIPAFKFELPRMSLPKVTISAKIRQPDRPRTINLPEINLDTSSRVATPQAGSNYGSNGAYGGASYGAANTHHQTYQQPAYADSDKAGEISFTSEEDTDQGHYHTSAGYAGNHPSPAAATGYSATNIHPSYQLIAQQHQQQQQQTPPKQQANQQSSFNSNGYYTNHIGSAFKEDSDHGFEPAQGRLQQRMWLPQRRLFRAHS